MAEENEDDRNSLGANVSQGERWASLAGGGAFALYGLSRRSPSGLALMVSGGYLLYRGLTGRCLVYETQNVNTAVLKKGTGISIQKSVTVNKPVEEAYHFWQSFDYLSRCMRHLQTAPTLYQSDKFKDNPLLQRAKQVVLGVAARWKVALIEVRENEEIQWRSQPGAPVENYGSVHFRKAPGGRGTEVKIAFEYKPAHGLIGRVAGALLNVVIAQEIKEEMRRYKHVLEAGVLPVTEGQSSGRAEAEKEHKKQVEKKLQRPSVLTEEDVVTEASWESFPASDPPSWQDPEFSRKEKG